MKTDNNLGLNNQLFASPSARGKSETVSELKKLHSYFFSSDFILSALFVEATVRRGVSGHGSNTPTNSCPMLFPFINSITRLN